MFNPVEFDSAGRILAQSFFDELEKIALVERAVGAGARFVTKGLGGVFRGTSTAMQRFGSWLKSQPAYIGSEFKLGYHGLDEALARLAKAQLPTPRFSVTPIKPVLGRASPGTRASLERAIKRARTAGGYSEEALPYLYKRKLGFTEPALYRPKLLEYKALMKGV